jgi:2-polyprenyl-6-methoxyphenol hydroxylase-like FAD-dependent oxidoreductase
MRFATTIQSFDQDNRGVKALLSDGSTIPADLLVGADGGALAGSRTGFRRGSPVFLDS